MNESEKILSYLRELTDEPGVELDENTQLIEGGIIDSFSITSLILFLEDLFGVVIEINEQTLRALKSVRNMTETFSFKAEV